MSVTEWMNQQNVVIHSVKRNQVLIHAATLGSLGDHAKGKKQSQKTTDDVTPFTWSVQRKQSYRGKPVAAPLRVETGRDSKCAEFLFGETEVF